MAEMTIPYHKPAADPSIISDAWDSGTNYNVGDYCIQGDVLYRAIQSGINRQPPNAMYWQATSVESEITSVRSTVSTLQKIGMPAANFESAHTLSPNTWVKYATLPLEKGTYAISVPFFRHQGGDSMMQSQMALTESETYTGEANSSCLSSSWYTCGLPVIYYRSDKTKNMNLFCAFSGQTQHTVDIRGGCYKVG